MTTHPWPGGDPATPGHAFAAVSAEFDGLYRSNASWRRLLLM